MLHPAGLALLGWAKVHIERRDYPEFFAMLAEIGRIREEQGEEATAAPEHAELPMKMMHAAPPRYREEVEAILTEAMPAATHVTEEGQPVYSAQQLADKLGVPIEQSRRIQRLRTWGYGAAAIPARRARFIEDAAFIRAGALRKLGIRRNWHPSLYPRNRAFSRWLLEQGYRHEH